MRHYLIIIFSALALSPLYAQVKIKADVENGTCVVQSTLVAAITCAGSSGVIEVPASPSPFAMTGNLTITPGVTLKFDGGANCITTTGFTLTINGPLVAPASQIFCGTGTVVIGAINTIAPVEWWGAVGDWSGSTGTDNTTAINSCFSSLTSGLCTASNKSYKITSALSITKAGVGFQGASGASPAIGSYPTPSPTQIVQTCSSCDILDVAGTSAVNAIDFNKFINFTLSRSVTPTGTAKGLSLVFVDSPIIDGVTSQDSIEDFYIRGVNATSAAHRIDNSFAIFGETSLTEPSGNIYGWYIDSADGSTNNSLYLKNTGVVSNYAHVGGSTTYAYYVTGSQTHDFFCYQCNASSTDYGIYINSTSNVFVNSSDMHILNSIIDACNISCIFTTGISGTLSITGGWFYTAGVPTTPVMDFESSANVSVVNASMYFPSGTGGGLLAHNGNSIQVIGTKFSGLDAGPAITYSSIANGVISGNDAGGVTATTIINLIASTFISVSDNTVSGTATNGIALDSGSNNISGLETNVCGGSGGTVTHCIVDSSSLGNVTAVRNLSTIQPNGTTSLLCTGNQPTFTSGFNAGVVSAPSAGSCSFFVTVGTGSAGSTGVIGLSPSAPNGWNCFASNFTRADVVQMTSNTTASATFTNFGTGFSATNWTNGDVIVISCFGH